MSIDISVFDRLLGEGEYLEWVGKSEPFKVSEGVHKKKLTMRWILCAVAAVVLTSAYLISISSSELQIQIVVPILTICIPLFVAIRPALDSRTLRKKLIYAITNKRIITYKSETDNSSMELERVGKIKIVDKGNGLGDVAFGQAAVNAADHKLRYIALSPKNEYENDVKIITGIVFYNVAELKKIKSLISKDIEITEAVAG